MTFGETIIQPCSFAQSFVSFYEATIGMQSVTYYVACNKYS